jgi:hypothetical protein
VNYWEIGKLHLPPVVAAQKAMLILVYAAAETTRTRFLGAVVKTAAIDTMVLLNVPKSSHTSSYVAVFRHLPLCSTGARDFFKTAS